MWARTPSRKRLVPSRYWSPSSVGAPAVLKQKTLAPHVLLVLKVARERAKAGETRETFEDGRKRIGSWRCKSFPETLSHPNEGVIMQTWNLVNSSLDLTRMTEEGCSGRSAIQYPSLVGEKGKCSFRFDITKEDWREN